MKVFLKSKELQLVNGGYLTSKENVPVKNKQFIRAQRHAEYIITFAEMAKGKDFVDKKADSLAELTVEVKKALAAKDKVFISRKKAPVKKLTDQLKDEAMAFMKFGEESSKIDKTNAFLQQFLILSEFEEFGLFFKEGIVKLNKIYTMKEIVTAVEATIDILD